MNPDRRRSGHRSRLPGDGASAVVVAVLAGINVVQHVLAPAWWWFAPAAAGALLVWARLTGLGWAQLGLGRDRWRSGAYWGLGASLVVAAAYLIGVLLPGSRSAFLDTRYHLPVSGALLSALVIIPIGTVLLEEIAFRSVLWAALARHTRGWRVLATTSVAFGLWHILPSLHLAAANPGVSAVLGGGGRPLVVVATVAFTALGGAVAGELRRRSGSVLASAGMHWATNSLGVLFGLVAWRLAG